MGAQTSKAAAGKEEAAVETPVEGAAVASKTNGQVNLHELQLFSFNCFISPDSMWAMCCVNGVLHVGCRRILTRRESGHMWLFSPLDAVQLFATKTQFNEL